MIKAAFFDIDGTLLSHSSGRVPADTRQALKRLREKGILVFTSTGRHILELDELDARDLEFDGYVLLNGQLCLDSRRKLLHAVPIHSEDIRGAWQIFEKMEIPTVFVEQDRTYMNFINERVRTAQAAISSPPPEPGRWDGKPVYMVNMFADEADMAEVMKQMPHCQMTRWNPYGVDIVSKDGGKVMGMEWMMNHFGIRREEIIAFGDGENDREMLAFAGIGVAMGNADAAVKACADYVTEDVDHGGIWLGLRKAGVI